jgi:hypothetical protein
MDFKQLNTLYQEWFTKDYTSISDDTSNFQSFMHQETNNIVHAFPTENPLRNYTIMDYI